jgi:hypothetical protein
MSIVNLNRPFDVSNITLKLSPSQSNSKQLSVLSSGKPLYVQSPRGKCMSAITDHISVKFNAEHSNIFVDWARDVKNRCYYLANQMYPDTCPPKHKMQSIVDFNRQDETASMDATVSKQEGQPSELIVYDETKTLRSETDVVPNRRAVFIFEIKELILTDNQSIQWHINVRQIMITQPEELDPEPNDILELESEPEPSSEKLLNMLEPNAIVDETGINRATISKLEPDSELNSESNSFSQKENEILGGGLLHAADISELDEMDEINDNELDILKRESKIEPESEEPTSDLQKSPNTVFSPEDDITEESNLLIASAETKSLALTPKREVYINMYKEAQINAELIKHQYIEACRDADAIKRAYNIKDAECNITTDVSDGE